MKVISRTSVMEYKDTTKKIPEIAAELGVANILEGGIQRSGNQVRINVQLIDAQTDEHLWAEIFDRELTAENLFAIQSEISTKIADALHATLSPEEQQRINIVQTASLDAYDAYLRGRQLMATRRVAELERATQEFLKAVELDSEFALAWVGVADSHWLLAGYAARPYADTIEIRENAIEKALAINPGLGEAYASLATVHEYHERREEEEQAYRKAIELSPNYATAYQWYSGAIRNDPLRSRERLDLVHRAVELDPRSMIIGANLTAEYMTQGLISRAEQQALKLIELYPESPNSHHQLVDLHSWATGELAEAMKHARTLGELDPDSFDSLRHQAEIHVLVGDLDAARAVQERIIEMNPDHWWAGWTDKLIAERNGNAAAIREAINWMQSRTTGERWQITDLADSFLIAGDVQKARELYLQANPEFLDSNDWDRQIKGDPLRSCVFSWVLINTGNADLGQALLKRTTRYLEQELPSAVEHADWWQADACYLVAGNTKEALDTLETQLAHGHFGYWVFDHQMPMYDLVRNEPRYYELLAERDRKLEIQRKLIAQLDAETGP
jgi:tetratricopeptide (TPR) repeat protein